MATIRRPTADEYDRVFDLTRQAFNIPPSMRDRGRGEYDPARARVVEDQGRIVASLRILPFGHLWGGRSLKGAGIGGVAVPAEQRGKGFASMLMNETLRELRAEGVFVSTLYPATVPIYRSVGYGFGGIRSQWAARLDVLPPRADLPVEPFGDDALDEVMACYERVARATTGLVDRDHQWWTERVLHSAWDEEPPYAYLVREGGDVTGFIIYKLEGQKDDWRSLMRCRDLFWTTPGAARALLALAAMHRSTSSKITWIGPPSEPLADLLSEDKLDIDFRFRFMVRLVDAPGAIEARGYRRYVNAGTTIAVHDPLFPANDGPWRIDVADGEAKVTPADDAEARADVQTWASIWSGLYPASEAARLGTLTATREAIEVLDAIFAGPTPWLADFF